MRKILTERLVRREIVNYLARKGWDRNKGQRPFSRNKIIADYALHFSIKL